MPKTPSTRLPFRSPYQRLIALWVLRAFSSSSAQKAFCKDKAYTDDDIAEFLKLPADPEAEEPGAIRRMMGGVLDRLEKLSCHLPPRAQRNFNLLASTLKLSPVEQRVAEILACIETENPLIDTVRVLRRSQDSGQAQFLSRTLKIPKAAVEKAISPTGRLARCGLLSYSCEPADPMPLQFRGGTMARQLLWQPFHVQKILQAIGVLPVNAPELRMEDFPHLSHSLELLLAYLRRSSGKQGVNILLHGPPGTGKTQLARTLGAKLSLPVFELQTSDEDGDPIDARSRLAMLNLALRFFQNDPGFLVFDEAEDILTPTLLNRGTANSHKGWFNQMLGSNPRPVCWISNSIETLDPAFARRFDFIIEVPVPPRMVRNKILKEQAGGLVSSRLIGQLTELDHLAPAVVTRVRDVVRTISRDIPKDSHDEAFTHVLGGILKAQGHPIPLQPGTEILPPEVYDTDCLNTGADLPGIARMLKSHPHARICLHGPPGTGKTAFGHWLAREINRPLQVKRASELLSPYIGETEMKIARTFERAQENEAILMIDEVDSFLQDRSKAVRSWEVTQVNELLTRMESFSGVFIATTNRLEHLDAASLRRFDLKLGFDFLHPCQIDDLLRAWCRSLGIAAPAIQHRSMMESMTCVTPGDFAAAARRHRFHPFSDVDAFLQALMDECALKSESRRPIGFLQS